jgi:phenylacetate-coenzyme A ligase PaaK-like adenylate-forming protein
MFFNFKNKVFGINNDNAFEKVALDIFHYQANFNKIYKTYINKLGIIPERINKLVQVPFLPIDFFKTQDVLTGEIKPLIVFKSSGTTGNKRSRHLVADISVYEESFLKAFRLFYGDIRKFCILALLPSYIEMEDSSLVYMIDKLIRKTGHQDSGFYHHNPEELVFKIRYLLKIKQRILFFGVSFALLDFAGRYKLKLRNVIVMETGGMKGRKEEITRQELHQILQKSFGIKEIHSEYGMTELLSQAYSKENGLFYAPPWMKILIRDTYDPFSYVKEGKSGGINIIDLANYNSCSFVETKDLGRLITNDSFEVLGRFDNSDIRGCNLLIEE